MAKNVDVLHAGLSGVPSSSAARHVYATAAMSSTPPICNAHHCNACSTRLFPVPGSPSNMTRTCGNVGYKETERSQHGMR